MLRTLWFVTSVALGGILLAAAPCARAQAGEGTLPQGATVRIDSTASRQPPPRAGGGPAGVEAVRRRIRQIRGVGPRRAPVFVIIPSPAPAARARPRAGLPRADTSLGARDRSASYYLPGRPSRLRNRRAYDYDTGSRRLFLPEQEGEELIPIRPDAPADSSAPPLAPRADGPTVRRVERAILETGLFRASNVNFEFDRSTLLPVAERTLDAVGEVLARYPALRIVVEGHTDAVGPAAYNQRLSERRAQAVVRYLNDTFGLDRARFQANGFGESEPVASNENATGRTLNRRVTFRVLNPEAAERYLEMEEPAATEEPPDAARQDRLLREAIRESVREAMEEQSSGTGDN